MKLSRLSVSMILASLAILPASFASEDFLVLLQGESANSALALHSAMQGPEVEASGTIKTLLLDPESGMRLSCDSALRECSITNSGFIPSTPADYDLLLALTGPAASKLFDSIGANGRAPYWIYHELGTSGKYGRDVIDCKRTGSATECRLYRTYCYYPGC
jgi:hypothetical protein